MFVTAYLLVVYLLAMISVTLLPMAVHLQLLVLVLLLVSGILSYRRYKQSYQLLWSDTDWILRYGDSEYNAELLSSSVVTASMTVLNFSLPGGRRKSLLLMPDSLHADQFRRLRVRLKVCGNKALAHAKMSL